MKVHVVTAHNVTPRAAHLRVYASRQRAFKASYERFVVFIDKSFESRSGFARLQLNPIEVIAVDRGASAGARLVIRSSTHAKKET